jgi:histidine ammonia-lyase
MKTMTVTEAARNFSELISRVHYRGEWIPAAEALRHCGIPPFTPSFKEGIALINGTSAMTALAAFALFGADKVFRLAHFTAAFAMEIFGGIDDAFDTHLHALKPHPGQIAVARTIRRLYHGSANITERADIQRQIDSARDKAQPVYQAMVNVQDVYSIRCTAQVLAPVCETLEAARKTIEIEANSVNDNPVVIPGFGILHGGNFHGQSLAFAMDTLGIAICTLCNLSERRVNKLLDNFFGHHLPQAMSAAPWGDSSPGIINLPAVVLVGLCALLLIRGASESAKVNASQHHLVACAGNQAEECPQCAALPGTVGTDEHDHLLFAYIK